MEMKYYNKTRVVSRNIITDWVQGIRNLLGLELKSYADCIDKTLKEMMKEMPKNMKWFKVDIEQIIVGGFMITIYGVKK